MIPLDMMDKITDPVEMLNRAFGRAWDDTCESCDVTDGLPGTQSTNAVGRLPTYTRKVRCIF